MIIYDGACGNLKMPKKYILMAMHGIGRGPGLKYLINI